MSLLGTLITPRIDAKIRSRLLHSKFRNKSPDFKDILRDRFRTRIKQNRRVLFQKMRTISESNECVQDTLCDYLQKEIEEFDQLNISKRSFTSQEQENYFNIEDELEVMKQIEMELLEEQLNWITEEYYKEEEQMKEIPEAPLLCPVCQQGFLNKMSNCNLILCSKCSIQLYSTLTIEQLNMVLRVTFDEHSSFCNATPQFTVINEPNSSGLFIICTACSAFNLLC